MFDMASRKIYYFLKLQVNIFANFCIYINIYFINILIY